MKLTASMMLTRGRRVPGPRRPRRGPPRRVRSRRMDGRSRRRGDVAVPDLLVRACGCVAARAQDLGDLGAVLAAPRRGRSGLPRHQRPAQVRALDHAQGPAWQNTHVIDGDVEAAVRELKAKPGRELQVHGSGDLLRWLLDRDLVDELNLRIYPVVVGDGLRLFPEQGPDARPGAGRVAIDAVRRDAPDLSTGRAGDLRQRR